jgi:hypothetical protein
MFGTTGTSIGNGVAWNGSLWVAVGQGTTYTIATSSDGINWTGVPNSAIIFTIGYGVAWNGSLWVAVGSGSGNTIATSPDGINWTGQGSTVFTNAGRSITWNGIRWVAGGTGGNTIATSPNGLNWTGLGTSIFGTGGYGISASNYMNTYTINNYNVSPNPLTPSDIVSLTSPNNSLDIVSDSYYQNGYDNFVFSVKP